MLCYMERLHQGFFVTKQVPVRTSGSIQTFGTDKFFRHRIQKKINLPTLKKLMPFFAFSLNILFITHCLLDISYSTLDFSLHSLLICSKNQLFIHTCFTVRLAGLKLWNAINTDTHDQCSLNAFKTAYKKQLGLISFYL